MEGIRFAWKIFSFSDVPSSSSPSSSSSARNATNNSHERSSSASPSRSRGSRRQNRRIPLHRACSLIPPSSSSNDNNNATSDHPSFINRKTTPGAYSVTRTKGHVQCHRVEIPQDVTPGSEFTAIIGSNRHVQVQCPRSARPGTFVRISLPGEPITRQKLLKMASLTPQQQQGASEGTTSPNTVANNKRATNTKTKVKSTLKLVKENKGVKVKIPSSILPGMTFTATLRGKRYLVTCPDHIPSNRKIRVVPSPQKKNINTEKDCAAPKAQLFDVAIPQGVQANEYFDILANGQRVTVQCPSDAAGGQTVRFRLPLEDIVSQIQMRYESVSTGWYRIVRPEDLKLQWVFLEEDENNASIESVSDSASTDADSDIDLDIRSDYSKCSSNEEEKAGQFDVKRSAFCRKLTLCKGRDPRMQTGTITLIPAQESLVETHLAKAAANSAAKDPLMTYGDIAVIQTKTLEEKAQWFREICNQLSGSWDDGNIKIVVARETLLEDSIKAVMSLSPQDMRKPWRFEFVGEPGVDSGGVSREWFQLASEQIFDPENGLWQCSANNQMCLTINPNSDEACDGVYDHLVYFRFAGRLLGRALFDQQLIQGHLVQSLYKYLLGWPLTFEDLAVQDLTYCRSLLELRNLEDVSMMCLDFTVTEIIAGEPTTVELVTDGAKREVTNGNLDEYLEAVLRYRMLERTKPQLTELLIGFLEVVPEPALAVFDSCELELVLCGLPIINVDDWEANTRYSGCLKEAKEEHPLAKWFWEIVRDSFDHEMRARLLQFVTGTSSVPPSGFAALQGMDGSVKTFALYGIENGPAVYPRAHTCFNRIDIGAFESKEDLEEKLRAALAFSAVGFGLD